MKDVNGTRYHHLLGARDWRRLLEGSSAQLTFDESHQSLTLTRDLFLFPARPGEVPLTPLDLRGAAADRYGTWYWIGPDEDEIRYAPPSSDVAGRFWIRSQLQEHRPAPPRAPGGFAACLDPAPPVSPTLRGLTVTAHQYLVVGTLEPAGLLVFDLHAGGPPVGWMRWGGVPFVPFDLAPSIDGGLWVLDLAEAQARLWHLDRYFRVTCFDETLSPSAAPVFAPFDGAPCDTPGPGGPVPLTLDLALDTGVGSAVAVEALSDGSVLVLQSDTGAGFSTVHRFREGLPAGVVALDAALATLLPEETTRGPELLAHDLAFLAATDSAPGPARGELYLATVEGNQSFVFGLTADAESLTLAIAPRYLPMRRFHGRGLVAALCDVHYDLEDRWVPLAEQSRPRYPESERLEGLVFDGKEPGTVWHRLLLDACIPDGTKVRVESRAADERNAAASAEWLPEPVLYRRAEGSELPFQQPFPELTEEERERRGAGTWELLFQNTRGRFSELAIELTSRGGRAPRIRALRIHYPRFSYAEHYLPAAYREDPVSGAFVERFLANPEGLFTTLEGRIERFEALLDARTAPEEYLSWLASWLGAALEESWNVERQRLFVAHAVELYRWRGTPSGLLVLLRLATDACPDERLFELLGSTTGQLGGFNLRLIEQFVRRQAPGVALGDPSELEQPGFAVTTTGSSHPCRFGESVASESSWDPTQGAEPLHARFRDFLRSLYGVSAGVPEIEALAALSTAWERSGSAAFKSFGQVKLSPVVPAASGAAADWRGFVKTGLGFTYAELTELDVEAYRRFLTRRHRRVSDLNVAYGRTGDRAWASFSAVTLPAEDDFPSSGTRLTDWIEFVSLFLPIDRNAHRMTVLVPTEPGETLDSRARRLAQVEAIVDRERPAHTIYEVKPFWALFQVGAARVGLDTVIGEGSRFTALELGSSFIGESYLSEPHPWYLTDRRVVGRDEVNHE